VEKAESNHQEMQTRIPQHELPPAVQRILGTVRRRIRAYVWLEGMALLVVVAGVAFWLGLAIDWYFEPSPALRQLGWIAFGLAGLYVAYRYLVRRVAIPISDASAAALLERRFPALSEHVLTAVDVASSPQRAALYHPDFVHQTQQSAAHAVAAVDASQVFNRRPLVRAIGIAAALVLSIGVFAVVSREAFTFWLDRLALSDEPWPRRVQLEVVGFPIDSAGQRTHKLAQEDDFELIVHAAAQNHEVPDEVEIRFKLADGRRGRDTMIRVGEARSSGDDFQLFRYQFKRIATDMEFDVVGGDDRVRDLRLEVVDRPELFAIELDCTYPAYLERAPRRMPVTGGMRIPEGTQIAIHAVSTKPLIAAQIHRANDKHADKLDFSKQPIHKLRWEYGKLADDDVLLINVSDNDGVTTREPYRISLAAVEDEVPQVAVRLAGIGSAVTPDAILPLAGKITDDYGLDRAWFEYQVGDGPIAQRGLSVPLAGEPLLSKLEAFDFRAIDASTGERAVLLTPGQRFSLTLKAADRFDLTEQPRAGASQQFVLDVVSPSNLIALLERRELALRQRYEAIYEKLTDTRDLLSRVNFDEGEEESAVPSSGDITADDANTAAAAQRGLARRRLRVAGSLQNVVQAGEEVAGVAEGFDDLCDQLTNNRIDNPDLISRLREQIAQPLHRIAEERMPQLTGQLKLVEQNIADASIGAPELAKSLALADDILVEMRQVLNRMLELETYNEVVALLRDIITDQDEISQRTKERQRERLRGLFEDE
jgi:hypothetical protein